MIRPERKSEHLKPVLQHNRFTLIELLVSMAVFSLIMLVLATMLYNTFMLVRKRNQRASLAQKEQAVGDLLRRDFRNMVASNSTSEQIIVTLTPTTAAFVTNSGVGVESADDNSLVGVSYELVGDELRRSMYKWNPTAGDWTTGPTTHVVTKGVATFSIDPAPYTSTTLPEIVTITVTLKDERDSDEEAGDDATRTIVTKIFVNQRNQL